MKCRIMWHFIWVFTVCHSAHLGAPVYKGLWIAFDTMPILSRCRGIHTTLFWTIKIQQECEVGIEKSVPRITVLHREACRVMTNGNCERRIFLSRPYTNNGFFFSLITKDLDHFILEKHDKENPTYAEMRHGDVILTLQ